MKNHFRRLGDHSALRGALIASVCVVVVLLTVGAATAPVLKVRLTGQTDNCLEQVERPTQIALAAVDIDRSFAEAILEELVDLEDPEDNDAERHVLRTDVSAFGTQAWPHESLADRASIPFRRRAFASLAPPAV